MGADLYLYVYKDGEMTDEDLQAFHYSASNPRWDVAYDKARKLPKLHVGEVSWAKAFVFGDDSYIPNICGSVSECFAFAGTLIDETLIKRLSNENANNQSHAYYETVTVDKLIDFLRTHIGKRGFTLSL